MREPKGTVEEKKSLAQCYAITFGGPHGEEVLEDLAHVCMAKEPLFQGNEINAPNLATAVLCRESMRQVYLHIEAQIKAAGQEQNLPRQAEKEA